uniref:Xylanolytic transcriptional activator regulatory domain-containing protein n=1 Tax=Psilocybe cubensis TaxID=181762 RepID=A0A8H7XP52_PSICU
MAPTVATLDFEHSQSPRPLKRARKSSTVAHNPSTEPEEHHFINNAPLDHIFIADGIASKKAGGKKVCRDEQSIPLVQAHSRCYRRLYHAANAVGVLVSGKGTRFILANTEQLHSKIQEMSDRIRSLEDGLQALHSERSPEPDQPHPLLLPELLGIKSTMGLYSGTQAHSSSDPAAQANSNSGKSPRHMEVDRRPMERGSSEDTITAPDHLHAPQHQTVKEDHSEAYYAAEIARLSHNFPLSDTISPEPNLGLREFIRSNLPPREEADHLWEQARQNALWQYNPHPSSTFYPNLAYHCYSSPTENLSPRRLSLLLMILAVGCLVDIPNREPDHPDAEKYHQLARASLCEIPVMEETNVETITALFYEIWYLLVFSDKKKAAGYAWGLMGLTAKLAQSIGLHRGSGKSKVIPEEVEIRRSLFWELLYLDARLSLSLGRPPSLTFSHTDCPPPSYTPDDDCNPTESLHYYQQWKHSCYSNCLEPVLDAISKPSQALNYDTVLDLDKRIRDFSIPPLLRNKDILSRSIVMQRASLSTALEAVLLQLHRQFFTRALSGPEVAFNRRHQYAPSVVAVFLSASRMIANVHDLYTREPLLTARILGYWSNAFSAAVALCLLVSRAPFTCLSPAALQELERARILFRAAKDTCPRALQVLPMLEKMIDKARYIFDQWSTGQELPTIVLRHITDDTTDHPDSANGMQNHNGTIELSHANKYARPNQYAPATVSQPQSDSFVKSHQSLTQCIVEVHQRAKALFPLRKPCQCSVNTQSCPPSHSWSPVPNIGSQTSPVLPPETVPITVNTPRLSPAPGPFSASLTSKLDMSPPGFPAQRQPISRHHVHYPPQGTGEGLYSSTVLPSGGPSIPPIPMTLSPTSKMAVVDTLNFELGALQSSSDQNWMAFF